MADEPFSPFLHTFCTTHQLFTLAPPESLQQEITQSTHAGRRWLNRQFTQASEGLLNVRVVLILGLAGLIFIQVARGLILMPATNLLWFLTQVLDLNWPRDKNGRNQSSAMR